MNHIIFLTCMILILVICVLGILGNFLNVLVLIRKDMRSSTNYFMLGLTFSDILLLVLSFLRTLNNVTPFFSGPESFTVFVFLWDWVCTSGTRYFTVVVSLERWIAVRWPLKARVWITPSRARWATLGVLLFTIVLAVSAHFYNKYLHDYGFELFAALILHFTPFVTIVILNILIYNGIRGFNKTRKQLTTLETTEISVTKMLLCVVLVFGFCHSFEIVRRIMNYANYFDFTHYKYYDYTISYLADAFYVLNSSVNFIIYYLMVKEFRSAFFKLTSSFTTCCKKTRDLRLASCTPDTSIASTIIPDHIEQHVDC